LSAAGEVRAGYQVLVFWITVVSSFFFVFIRALGKGRRDDLLGVLCCAWARVVGVFEEEYVFGQ